MIASGMISGCSDNPLKSGLKEAANDNSFKSEFKIDAQISSLNEEPSILQMNAVSGLRENPFGFYVEIGMETASESNEITAKNYIIQDGDKYITYSEDSGTWFKTETDKNVTDLMIGRYSGKIIWEELISYTKDAVLDTSFKGENGQEKYILTVPKKDMAMFFNTTGVLDFIGLSGISDNELEKVENFTVHVILEDSVPVNINMDLTSLTQSVFDKLMDDQGITDPVERVKIDKYIVSINLIDQYFNEEIILPKEAESAIDLTIDPNDINVDDIQKNIEESENTENTENIENTETENE